jgi:hypothetical protein
VPEANGDEEIYADRRESFAKTLPHNDLGEVDPEVYREWLAILASGDSKRFEQAPRDIGATEKSNNPQAAYSLDLVGTDAAELPLQAPPCFASRAMAAEMVELYWRALLRDLPFREYESSPLVRAAVSDFDAAGLSANTEAILFRGETAGDRAGPFVSQFLWREIPYGVITIEQRFRLPALVRIS